MPGTAAEPFTVQADGALLSGEQSGEGTAVALLHGLTATRRYVVMGSRTLERSGHKVISYDARGHGHSGPASNGYGYERLVDDLASVLVGVGVSRAVIAGASMGAHTAVRLALERPELVNALVLITPAYEPSTSMSAAELEHWDSLARGLREGGVQGFISAYDLEALPPKLRPTIETVLHQRMSAHEYPLAVADALEAVPRSSPFKDMNELAGIDIPTLIVASRDEADPGHPLSVAKSWARMIPDARLVVEEQGPPLHSPIAWQGGQLSKLIAEMADIHT